MRARPISVIVLFLNDPLAARRQGRGRGVIENKHLTGSASTNGVRASV
jgi:hypothetical protein